MIQLVLWTSLTPSSLTPSCPFEGTKDELAAHLDSCKFEGLKVCVGGVYVRSVVSHRIR